MPVGTNAAVKAISVDDLHEIGFEIILANTYHCYLRPGPELIGRAGGLHGFMNWDKNILTDSGGFQVFSLAAMRKISEEGVEFQSHIDGSRHRLTPEDVVRIQSIYNSDIQMQLDVCSPPGISRGEAEEALRITNLWMGRAVSEWKSLATNDTNGTNNYRGQLFAIVQGNFFKDLRKASAQAVIAADTPGIAIGGLSVGEEASVFKDFLAYTADLLPKDKPRYVMGIGTPEYILEAIENGIDMFDCVLPTRVARNGQVFTRQGPLVIKQAQWTEDLRPIDESCGCKVCQINPETGRARYSRAYLRHLFKTQEILWSMLASYHNLYFLYQLVLEARRAIEEGRFSAFKKDFLGTYQ
jgi:queuine tRNA-ribosyltransferase